MTTRPRPSWIRCPDCHGKSVVPGPYGVQECPTCKGLGTVKAKPEAVAQ